MTPADSDHPLLDDVLRRRLATLARRWLAHGDEAEDMLQDAFLRTAAGGLPATVAGTEAWLVTVVHHLCIDALRRRNRLEALLGRIDDARPEHAHDLGPERLAEQAQRIDRALDTLVRAVPARDAAIVLLVEVFDFSHAELGALTGRSDAASRQHLHRVLSRVKSAWGAPPAPTATDDESAGLLALCRHSLAQRDPAPLVAMVRGDPPRARAVCMQTGPRRTDPGDMPWVPVLRLRGLLALLTQGAEAMATWLPADGRPGETGGPADRGASREMERVKGTAPGR